MMGEWHRNHPEEAEAISRLPLSQQNAAERAVIPDPRAIADDERQRRQDAIHESFTAWHQDPVRIARLLRWLILLGERPENTADFIEHAETWQKQYDEMRIFEADQ